MDKAYAIWHLAIVRRLFATAVARLRWSILRSMTIENRPRNSGRSVDAIAFLSVSYNPSSVWYSVHGAFPVNFFFWENIRFLSERWVHISMIITFFFTKGRSTLLVCFLFCFFVSKFVSPASFTASFSALLEEHSNDAFSSRSLRRLCCLYFLRCSLHRSQDTRLSPAGIASFRLQYLHWDAWGTAAIGCSMFASGSGGWRSPSPRIREILRILIGHVIVRQK